MSQRPIVLPPAPLVRAGTLLLLALGLAGHLYAAHAVGGSAEAYTHHVLGFALILAVTGGVLAVLGRRLWPMRWPATLLVIGLVQAVAGLAVAAAPARVVVGP